MLRDSISLSNLPVSIPQNAYCSKLAQIIGTQAALGCPWIALSLVHPSYLNEQLSLEFDRCGIPKGTFALIGELGNAFLELVLYHLAYQDPRVQTPGEADSFCQRVHRQNVALSIAEDCHLAEIAFMGKGVSRELNDTRSRPKILSLLAHQFLGAVRICSSYETLVSLVVSSAKVPHQGFVSTVPSYKGLLQGYTQGRGLGRPEYTVIEETGPDHSKRFRVQARTHDGKSAVGEGCARKSAEEMAARQYMEMFASHYFQRKTSQVVNVQQPLLHTPPEPHRREVERLSTRLGIPSDKSWLLSQALVHRSFLNEWQSESCQNNIMLAQLGSRVLVAIATEVAVDSLLRSISARDIRCSATQVVSAFSDTLLSEGFDFLRLEDSFLVSRGQFGQGLTDTIKVEAFQAVFAAMFLAHGTMGDAEVFLPTDLYRWLQCSIEALIAGPDKGISQKTKLQNQLQAIGMPWEYRLASRGPSHAREFEASIALSSHSTNRRFVIKGGKGANRRQAETDIASRVSRIIDETNSGIGTRQSAMLFEDQGPRSFACFLLRHELACAPTSPLEATKWHKVGMLGSKLLTEGKFEAFTLWASAAESLLCEGSGEMPDLGRVLRFYRELTPPAFQDKPRHLYQESTVAVRRLIGELDPEKLQPDVRQSREFSDILSLSKISRLLSRERRLVHLSDILDDFLLLRRNRPPMIHLKGRSPDLCIAERDGVYQTMLNEILILFDNEDFKDDSAIELSVVHKPEEMKLEFDFELPCRLKSTDETQGRIGTSSLWGFLKDEIPIATISVSTQRIGISCRVYTNLLSDSFSAKALEAYRQDSVSVRTENEEISRFFHDLKNQLIAYQVSLESPGAARTSLLKSKYEASRHLDTAKSICYSLEAVGRAMSSPTITAVDMNKFFREYVAEKIATVPSNIRIVPPRAVGSCQVWTAPDFLYSIIENLVKNSVEAMPKGGEVHLDWTFDQAQKSLRVEVADTGPGIDKALLDRLLAGRSIESTKGGGSGIGMLVVNAMLQRVYGTISVTSSEDQGTRWILILPSLEETSTVP